MKRILLLSITLCFCSVYAQKNVLKEIERNNTVLSALRHQTEADKTGNKTGLNPDNPEVEFHYLWGNSDVGGNRTDWTVSQSFDFPTAYHHKRKMADLKNQQLELQYQIQRKDILLEASVVCIRLIYQNALSKKLKEQFDLTQQIADSYQKRFDTGDVSLLDLNKAKYDLIDAQKDYLNAMTEKEFLLSELIRLNGGIPLQFNATRFPKLNLPLHFETWYNEQRDKNADLKLYRQDVTLSQQNEKLQRSMNLPKISTGYMSESVMTERFQGVMVGISVPLWENKNTVKQIKSQTLASQEIQKDAILKNFHQTEALFKKAQNLLQTLSVIKEQQEMDNTVELLKKSLTLGEISLIDFILELGIYYNMQQNMLEIEQEFHLTAAELMQWEL